MHGSHAKEAAWACVNAPYPFEKIAKCRPRYVELRILRLILRICPVKLQVMSTPEDCRCSDARMIVRLAKAPGFDGRRGQYVDKTRAPPCRFGRPVGSFSIGPGRSFDSRDGNDFILGDGDGRKFLHCIGEFAGLPDISTNFRY